MLPCQPGTFCAVFPFGRCLVAFVLISWAIHHLVAAPHLAAQQLQRLPPTEPTDQAVELAPSVEDLPPPPNLPVNVMLPVPWWTDGTMRPMRPDSITRPITVESVVVDALYHSEFLRAAAMTPRIRQQDVAVECGQFDPSAFLESKFNDTSVPIGNLLTTGRATGRFNDHDVDSRVGLRQKLNGGTQVLATQDIGLQDTNSAFFIPNDQAVTRISVSVSQPLLKGRGADYNQSFVLLAQLNAAVADRQYSVQLQDYIRKVANSYWQLTLERSILLQRVRHLESAREIHTELSRRRSIDLLRNQLLRAEAAVATRSAAVARSEAAVQNAEAQLRSLTNAPDLSVDNMPELVTVELPSSLMVPVDRSVALVEALHHRVEVDEVLQRVRAAKVRLGIADNEFLPSLNLILSAYVEGLRGDYDVARSLSAQFDEGAPSYTAGVLFDVPLYRRAAAATQRKRQMELAQLMHETNHTLAQISTEVEVAARSVQTAQQELEGQYRAMEATQAELDYLWKRWRHLPGNDGSSSFLLSEMLDTQDRLRDAEAAYARSLTDYAMSFVDLRRATGRLLILDQPQPVP